VSASVSIPMPRIAAGAFGLCAGFLFVLALVLGGGTRLGFVADAIVQLAALPLLAGALLRLGAAQWTPCRRWALIVLGAIVALPLVQLLPLPPLVWMHLPGRAGFAAAYDAAGIAPPWQALSLDATATWWGLLSLVPAAAVFLAMLSLTPHERHRLIRLLFAVLLVSVLLDLMQMMGGPESPLRFYAITNIDRADGFFANSNHNAAFLYAGIPFVAAWGAGRYLQRPPNRLLGLAAMALLLVLIVIGLSLALSRAGMALGLLGGLLALLIVARRDTGGHLSGRARYAAFAVVLAAAIAAFQFGFAGFLGRSEAGDLVENLRWAIAAVTSQAALSHLPFGTGFGTFVPIYDMYAPRTLLDEHYVNHAHNDWLELWLTGGWPAAAVALGSLAWFARVSLSAWRARPHGMPPLDCALARAASVAVVLLLLHSIVDYPLRTTALTVLLAMACALLLPDEPAADAVVVTRDMRDQRPS
jgi:hypothetical protein